MRGSSLDTASCMHNCSHYDVVSVVHLAQWLMLWTFTSASLVRSPVPAYKTPSGRESQSYF